MRTCIITLNSISLWRARKNLYRSISHYHTHLQF